MIQDGRNTHTYKNKKNKNSDSGWREGLFEQSGFQLAFEDVFWSTQTPGHSLFGNRAVLNWILGSNIQFMSRLLMFNCNNFAIHFNHCMIQLKSLYDLISSDGGSGAISPTR